jgi:hemoglobin
MTTLRGIRLGILIAAPIFVGTAAAQEKTLYQRLGGYDAIAAVTDDFIARLASDPKLGRFFVGFSTDGKMRIRQHVVDLICKVSGGPCSYLGRDVKVAHAGAGITKADWDRSVELFGETLAKFNVAEHERKDLAAIIVPLEKDIVDK